MSEEISQEEKINYIYDNLKTQEKRRKWSLIGKWGFRIFLIGYMYYFITIGLPVMIDSFIPDIPTISGSGGTIDSIKGGISDYFSK